MSSDDTKIILEHFDNKFAQLVESMDGMIDMKIQPLKEDISELRSDTKVVKSAVAEISHDIKDIDDRVTALESAA